PHPALIGMEIEFFRNLRDWSQARAVAEEALTSSLRRNFWIWSHKVQIATLTGRFDEAAKELEDAPASSQHEHARVFLLRGQLAEAQFNYHDAISEYRDS